MPMFLDGNKPIDFEDLMIESQAEDKKRIVQENDAVTKEDVEALTKKFNEKYSGAFQKLAE